MLDSLHVLEKGKVAHFGVRVWHRLFKFLMHCAQRKDSVLDGGLDVRQLQYSAAPELGFEKLGPSRESACLEELERAVFQPLWT